LQIGSEEKEEDYLAIFTTTVRCVHSAQPLSALSLWR